MAIKKATAETHKKAVKPSDFFKRLGQRIIEVAPNENEKIEERTLGELRDAGLPFDELRYGKDQKKWGPTMPIKNAILTYAPGTGSLHVWLQNYNVEFVEVVDTKGTNPPFKNPVDGSTEWMEKRLLFLMIVSEYEYKE